MMDKVLLALALVLTLAASTAAGATKAAPPLALRGSVKPPRAPAVSLATPAPNIRRPPLEALLLTPTPSLAQRTASSGGARCRQLCANDLYLCRSVHEDIDCNPNWSRCVTGCPQSSSNGP